MFGYFDIHSHILPNLDDGSTSLEETKKMLQISYKEGIDNIIATPHFRLGRFLSTKDEIKEAYNKVQQMIQEENLSINLYYGNEIYYSHDIADLLLNKQIYTLANTDYVLVEFSTLATFNEIKSGLQDLIMNGFWPIIAHFERYKNIYNKWRQIEEIIGIGAYIQVNSSSFFGGKDRSRLKFVKKLLKYNMIHFIAADAHGETKRPPTFRTSLSMIQKKYGEERVNTIMKINPRKLINNEII